jgi:flagellar protein FlgJ
VTELSPLDIPLAKEAGRYVNARGEAAPATMTARQASEAGYNPMSAGQEAKAQAQAKSEAEFLATVPESIESARDMLRQIDELSSHPQLPRTVGPMGWMPAVPGVNSDAMERIKQIQGGVFLQAYQKLKGAGQITEVEGLKAEQALARLGRAQTLREMKQSLGDLRSVVSKSMDRMQAKSKGGSGGSGAAVNWEDLPE